MKTFLNEDFPRIECMADLKDKVSHLPEIRFNIHDNGYVTVCYMISKNDTFSGEHAQWARECRGITFYPDGKIASRPLAKFFNVNERESTQRNALDWTKVVRISDKRDGSMISPVLVNGEPLLKSKKSFTSDVANLANAYMTTRQNIIDFCKELLTEGFTPIFEYTSPNARIVINYKEEALTLLHIRNNITGSYCSRSLMDNLAFKYHIPMVKEYPLGDREFINSTMEYYFNSVENDKDFEGYVFQFENGNMVKLKSRWYLELHHNMVFLTERNIAEMVLSETLDDYKSYLAEAESEVSIKRVNEIEDIVCQDITNLEEEVEGKFNEFKHLERKEFVMQVKNEKLFGLIMAMYSGKEPDYKDWYGKWFLKNKFGLTQV